MAGRAGTAKPPLITDARWSTSLSTDQRMRRYVLTMLFRVVCFIAAVPSPPPWNVVLFVSAALLPGIAVLLGNARDNRPAPVASDDEPQLGRPALTVGEIIRGDVEDRPS